MKNISVVVIGLILFITLGCGSNSPTPVPAPPPQVPNPVPTTPVPTGPGGCGVQGGGIPLHSDNSPFIGNLTAYDFYGGYGQNSLSLNFYFVNGYSADSIVNSISGGGLLNFPDLALFFPQNALGQPQQQISTCVSSSYSGAISSGVYSSVDNSIAIVLQGRINVPMYTYSPFDYYPGGTLPYYPNIQGTSQQIIQVSLGNRVGCSTWLFQGRIYGCVEISIGTSNYFNLIYQSR